MNWLAHLHLSGDSPETRIGNLLPDLLKPADLAEVPARFSRGIRLHQRIDAYTDKHPIFRQSVARIDGPLRRYGPILIDLFYDHFLSLEWSRYSPVPLLEVVSDFHASIDTLGEHLPEIARQRLVEIREQGFLLSYHTTPGIGSALGRISGRLRRPVDLAAGVDHLLVHYETFAADFRTFYPELIRHAASADP